MCSSDKRGIVACAVIYNIIYFSISTLRATVCPYCSLHLGLTGSSGYLYLICFSVLVILAPLAALGLGGSLLLSLVWVLGFSWGSAGRGSIHRGRCTRAHRLSAVSILILWLGRLAGIIETKLLRVTLDLFVFTYIYNGASSPSHLSRW